MATIRGKPTANTDRTIERWSTLELARVIRAVAAQGARPPTLRDVRAASQKSGVTWSKEGELLFPQDRTAFVIELDELIDAY
jgi:hypothetical protein